MSGAASVKMPLSSKVFMLLGAASVAIVLKYVWPGYDYYLLSLGERPMHAYHDGLRSSGIGGLAFGLAGTILMVLNLTYLLRARLYHYEWLGSLRSWMNFHVFTGLVGPLLIVFHSTFLLRSPLASIAFLALMVVACTGVVGRYIYAHTPRSVAGKEMELADLQKNLGAYRADMQTMGLSMDIFEKTLPAVHRIKEGSGGIFMILASFVETDRRQQEAYRKLQDAVLMSPEMLPHAKDILALGQRYFKERQWIERYQELRALMSGWRFFHRWFAIVMVIIASFHIFVAIAMGDLQFPWLMH
jgi:hypothetical protein